MPGSKVRKKDNSGKYWGTDTAWAAARSTRRASDPAHLQGSGRLGNTLDPRLSGPAGCCTSLKCDSAQSSPGCDDIYTDSPAVISAQNTAVSSIIAVPPVETHCRDQQPPMQVTGVQAVTATETMLHRSANQKKYNQVACARGNSREWESLQLSP